MTTRFKSFQRVAVSIVAAFVLSTALLSAVVTLAPIA